MEKKRFDGVKDVNIIHHIVHSGLTGRGNIGAIMDSELNLKAHVDNIRWTCHLHFKALVKSGTI